MRKDHARKLNLNKQTIAKLSQPAMNRLFGGMKGDDPLALASTRPQCDSVKPLTAVIITTIPVVNTTTH